MVARLEERSPSCSSTRALWPMYPIVHDVSPHAALSAPGAIRCRARRLDRPAVHRRASLRRRSSAWIRATTWMSTSIAGNGPNDGRGSPITASTGSRTRSSSRGRSGHEEEPALPDRHRPCYIDESTDRHFLKDDQRFLSTFGAERLARGLSLRPGHGTAPQAAGDAKLPVRSIQGVDEARGLVYFGGYEANGTRATSTKVKLDGTSFVG